MNKLLTITFLATVTSIACATPGTPVSQNDTTNVSAQSTDKTKQVHANQNTTWANGTRTANTSADASGPKGTMQFKRASETTMQPNQ